MAGSARQECAERLKAEQGRTLDLKSKLTAKMADLMGVQAELAAAQAESQHLGESLDLTNQALEKMKLSKEGLEKQLLEQGQNKVKVDLIVTRSVECNNRGNPPEMAQGIVHWVGPRTR